MSLHESQRVSYVGFPKTSGLGVGDEGVVLSVSGDAAHVRWASGARVGQIDLVDGIDLAPRSAAKQAEASLVHAFDDSLGYGPPVVHTAVRETFDETGPEGLFTALVNEGHLGALSSVAEEALGVVAARVREDEAMRQVLAGLEPEEGEALVALTASVVLRDAFGAPGD
jgi:hypothetical protein